MNERHQGGRSPYGSDDYSNPGQQSYPSRQRSGRVSQEWDDEDRMPRDLQQGRSGRSGSQRYSDDEMDAGGRGYGRNGGILRDYDEQAGLRQRGYRQQQEFGRQDPYGTQQDFGSLPYGQRQQPYPQQQGSMQRGYERPWRSQGSRSMGPAYGTDMHDTGRYANDSGMYRGYGQGSDGGMEYGRQDTSWRQDGRGLYGQGMGQQQDFRGRGPKNYTRSDERIREDISERLSDEAAVDASEIEVHVKDGTVRLTGTVANRWMKHRAEDIADRCGGVKDIENQLRVKKTGDGASQQDHEGAGSEQEKAGGPSRTSRSNH